MRQGIKTMFEFVLGRGEYARPTRYQREVEAYLAKSTDLVDLERRERELTRKGYL